MCVLAYVWNFFRCLSQYWVPLMFIELLKCKFCAIILHFFINQDCFLKQGSFELIVGYYNKRFEAVTMCYD